MWKDIVGFEDRYEISNSGKVRNKKTGVELSLKLDRDGYNQIGLRKIGDRKKYWYSIHRLVATHFIVNTNPTNNHVDHIDHNKTNNNVDNLRWISLLDNNLSRELKPWKTNKTSELYITKYKNGYMIRINRKDYKKRIWERDLETAIIRRDQCIEEIKLLAPTIR